MKGQNAEIQPQELSVGQSLLKKGRDRFGIAVQTYLCWPWHNGNQNQLTRQCQNGSQPEYPMHPNISVQHWSQHKCQGKGSPDGHPKPGHGLSAMFFPCEIGDHGQGGGSDCSGSLAHSCHNHSMDRIRHSRDSAAQRKYQEARRNDGLASYPVGEHTQWDLEYILGESVKSQRKDESE